MITECSGSRIKFPRCNVQRLHCPFGQREKWCYQFGEQRGMWKIGAGIGPRNSGTVVSMYDNSTYGSIYYFI